MKRRLLPVSLILTILTGCAGFSTGRNFLSEDQSSNDYSPFFDPRSDFRVTAGDTGSTGMDESDFLSGAPRTKEESERDRTTMALERELAELEDSQSSANSELYNKHKHSFHSTSEKIFYLKLPNSERRSYLISKGIMKEPRYEVSDLTRQSAIRQSGVLMGMNKSDVMTSWGRPARVEVAGNPSYENERWAYQVNGATKYIYFESGKVDGWE